MSATRDGKMWRCQFYYKDWQGVSYKKIPFYKILYGA